MIVESANPVHSLADSRADARGARRARPRRRDRRRAHRDRRAAPTTCCRRSSQYEKWEATFFTLEFPENVFHLRAPILDPLPGTLPEPEIHRAPGARDRRAHRRRPRPLARRGGSRAGRLRRAFLRLDDRAAAPRGADPGRALRDARADARRRQRGRRAALGRWRTPAPSATPTRCGARASRATASPSATRSSTRSSTSRSGVTFTVDDYDETWRRLDDARRQINLTIPELLDGASTDCATSVQSAMREFPFVLSAGERRSSTANTIFRDPAWRKKDAAGALRMKPRRRASRSASPTAAACAITTRRGSAEAVVEVNACMQPGHVSLPNGLGLSYPDDDGATSCTGSRRTSSPPPTTATGSPALPGTSTCPRASKRSPAEDGRAACDARASIERPCPIARATDLIGDWWTPLVLREAFAGRRRFEDFSAPSASRAPSSPSASSASSRRG